MDCEVGLVRVKVLCFFGFESFSYDLGFQALTKPKSLFQSSLVFCGSPLLWVFGKAQHRRRRFCHSKLKFRCVEKTLQHWKQPKISTFSEPYGSLFSHVFICIGQSL